MERRSSFVPGTLERALEVLVQSLRLLAFAFPLWAVEHRDRWVSRNSRPEVENLVLDGVRNHLAQAGAPQHSTALDDRELIEHYVEKVIVTPRALEVRLAVTEAAAETDRGRDEWLRARRASDNPR